jgi:hypothetical protein
MDHMLAERKRDIKNAKKSEVAFKPVSFDFDWLHTQPRISAERVQYIEEITRRAFLAVTKD